MSLNEQELTELFRKLGADDPGGWARSQVREGIPQLPRYLFLRQAWRNVVSSDDQSWMSESRSKNPNAPGGALGPSIDRILAAGARAEDLTTIVRIMQWRLLAGLCVLLDDPISQKVKSKISGGVCFLWMKTANLSFPSMH